MYFLNLWLFLNMALTQFAESDKFVWLKTFSLFQSDGESGKVKMEETFPPICRKYYALSVTLVVQL